MQRDGPRQRPTPALRSNTFPPGRNHASFLTYGSALFLCQKIDALLPKNDDGEFVAFADSITMSEALEAGYVEEIPDYLDEDAPSGYDAEGNPLEHSDVVHDFLAHLAERMQQMHREKQDLWDDIRSAFLNCGVDPDDLSSLSVTKGIRDYVRNARTKSSPTPKQRGMRTYADKAETAFGGEIAELYEEESHDYAFEDLPRLGFERFKWLVALRGAAPTLMDDVHQEISEDLETLQDVLQRIGSGPWYAERNPATGEYDAGDIRSTDWLIDQIVYRLYGLTQEEIRVTEALD